MIADVLPAVVTYLAAVAEIDGLVDGRVYGEKLPAADVSAMPRKCIVITSNGEVPSAGTNSYIQVARPRYEVRCYGETPYEARVLYRAVHAALKGMTANVSADVRLHNALQGAGPTALVDPDADWPFVWSTWGVSASEVEVS